MHMHTHTHAHAHTHTHTHTCAHARTHTHTHPVPSDAPGELKVSHSLPTTAKLSWSPLPKEKRNGVITGYKVQIEGPDLQREIQAEEVSVELSSLKPSTSYTFKISAMTKAGTGPAASVTSKTPDGKTHNVYLWHML